MRVYCVCVRACASWCACVRLGQMSILALLRVCKRHALMAWCSGALQAWPGCTWRVRTWRVRTCQNGMCGVCTHGMCEHCMCAHGVCVVSRRVHTQHVHAWHALMLCSQRMSAVPSHAAHKSCARTKYAHTRYGRVQRNPGPNPDKDIILAGLDLLSLSVVRSLFNIYSFGIRTRT